MKSGKILKQLPNERGYPRVTLKGLFEDQRRPVLVAQLVMHTFAPEVKPRRYIIRYRDGNRKNVAFKNLFYSTRSEMLKGFWKEGVYLRPAYRFPCGPLNPRWKDKGVSCSG